MHVTDVLMDKISPGRATAFLVLQAVFLGAYASDTLRENSQSLDARDAALASQIVFGCLRFEYQLDYLLEFYSHRKASTQDPAVLIALRAAIFQLLYLDRVPPHAVVHESVEFVKHYKAVAAPFVNAVLRKVKGRPAKLPNEAISLSCPPWLLGRWKEHFGAEQAGAIAKAALEQPPAYIRITPGHPLPDGIVAEPTGVEGAWRLLSSLAPGLRLHDISSQAVLPLLDLHSGLSYLDLCAAPGNKTLQACETNPSLAIACDISLRRLRQVPPVCPRILLDATRTLPFNRPFDRIFIDAPCSGTGTLARNPEIKGRVLPKDFLRFQTKQLQIVAQALPLLAPSGKLLYATCSLEREENEDVVRQTLEKFVDIRCEREMWRLPGRDEGDGFYAAVLTH